MFDALRWNESRRRKSIFTVSMLWLISLTIWNYHSRYLVFQSNFPIIKHFILLISFQVKNYLCLLSLVNYCYLSINSKSLRLSKMVRYLQYSSSFRTFSFSNFNTYEFLINSLILYCFARQVLKGVYPKLNSNPAIVIVLMADSLVYSSMYCLGLF